MTPEEGVRMCLNELKRQGGPQPEVLIASGLAAIAAGGETRE